MPSPPGQTRAFSSPRPCPKRAGQEQYAADLRNSGLRLRAERIVPEVILSGGGLGGQDRVGLASREPGVTRRSCRDHLDPSGGRSAAELRTQLVRAEEQSYNCRSSIIACRGRLLTCL